MNQSMSSPFKPLCSRASMATSSRALTATLKTSFPCILIYVFAFSSWEEAQRSFQEDPSECRWVERIPLFPVVLANSAAPAPSPKSTQVFLSVQSVILENISAPMTSAYLECPDFIKLSATERAYINPEHAAAISKDAALRALILCCTKHAVDGK